MIRIVFFFCVPNLVAGNGGRFVLQLTASAQLNHHYKEVLKILAAVIIFYSEHLSRRDALTQSLHLSRTGLCRLVPHHLEKCNELRLRL